MMSRAFALGVPGAGQFLTMSDEDYRKVMREHGWSERAIQMDLDARKTFFERTTPPPPEPRPGPNDLDAADPLAQAVLRRRQHTTRKET